MKTNCDHYLPPSLTNTKAKLLEWIEPFLNDEQFQETTEAVNRFFEVDREAEILQEKLHEWDDKLEGSLLNPLRDDLYLKHRDSLPTGMHFHVLFDDKKHENRYTQSQLVAKLSRIANSDF